MEKTEKPIILELRNITKSFGGNQVLKHIDLAIREGEFVTFLGSSGCGKTTTLRIIAGLEAPDSGAVLLDGADMAEQPPEKRNVNTVFQNYALFPHIDVFQNIAYSLKIRHVDKAEIARRVEEMLSLVQLEGFEKRKSSELSGGQRQRVAIARSLINRPKVLLLDEPLGALDLQLRRQMQIELKRLQKQLGTTFIYVTHDQEEAINMSDRIVVMRDGAIEQDGTPGEVYDHPRTSYVARFIGNANILTGTVEAPGILRCDDGTMRYDAQGTPLPAGAEATIAVRGENIRIGRAPEDAVHITGVVEEKTYAGGMLRISVRRKDGAELVVSRQGINSDLSAGEQVSLDWPAEAAVVVDREAQP